MQLVFRLADSPGEWGLVELQGQLETRHQVPFDGMHLGDLHFDAQVYEYFLSPILLLEERECPLVVGTCPSPAGAGGQLAARPRPGHVSSHGAMLYRCAHDTWSWANREPHVPDRRARASLYGTLPRHAA